MDEKRTTSYIDENGNRKTGVTSRPAYNPNTDYQSLMNQAAGKRDYAAAGYYEQQRADKIAGQGLTYKPTKKYADYYGQVDPTRAAQLEQGYSTLYDPKVDYSAYMQKAAAAKDYAAAGYYEDLRNKKIAGEGLSYAPSYNYAGYLGQVDPVRAAELNRGYQTPEDKLAEEGYMNAALRILDDTYQKQIAANDEQSAAQTALQMEALERQKQKAADDYAKVNRQLYVDARQTERRLPEQLAAMGYTGGAAESAMLRNQLSYEQALRDNEAARIAGEQDIEFQGRQIQQQEDIARRQAAMQMLSDYQSGYTGIMGQMQSQRNYEDEQEWQRQNYQSEQEWQRQTYQTEQELNQKQLAISYAQAAAETMAQYGDFSGYAKVTDMYGNRMYSDAQIAAMKAQYDALMAAQSFSSGGSGGGRSGRSGRSGSGTSTIPAGTTQDVSNWNVSNKSHEDIDYSSTEAVQNAVTVSNSIRQMMINGESKKTVSAKIDEASKSGLISDDAARRLKAQNSARDTSETGSEHAAKQKQKMQYKKQG